MKKTASTNHIFHKALFLLVILILSLTACKKVGKHQLKKLDKTGKELVGEVTNSIDKFTETLRVMPNEFERVVADTIIPKIRKNTELLIAYQTATHKEAAKELINDTGDKINTIIGDNIKNVDDVLKNLGEMYRITTKEHIQSAKEITEQIGDITNEGIEEIGGISDRSIKEIGDISDRSLIKIGGIAKSFGFTLENSVDTISATMENSMSDLKEIADALSLSATQTTLLMTGRLDELLEKNILLADKIIEKRIDQLARRASGLLDDLDEKMNNLVDKISQDIDRKIEVVTWNSIVIVERTADIANETYGKMNITTVRTYTKFLMLGTLAFFFLGALLDKIELRRRNFLLIIIFLGICSPAFSDNVMYTLYGRNHILAKDFRKMANDNYDKIYTSLTDVSENKLYGNEELIDLCEDTFEMYARCIVLTSPQNITRRSRYEERMENLQYAIKIIDES